MAINQFISSQFVDIIEWLQTDRETMVYRFPRYRNEIKYGAKLIVREGQQAVLVHEGSVADVFTPGTYVLETANLPILSALQNWHHGFESPFKVEVYFFNMTDYVSEKWGTQQPVFVEDERLGMVRLRAFGQYTIAVADPVLLLKKLVGTDGNFEINEISARLSSILASQFPVVLSENHIAVLELPKRYDELAKKMLSVLTAMCEQYGLYAGHVLIESISLPDNVQQMIDEKTNLNILGHDLARYQQLQAAKSLTQPSHAGDAASGILGATIGAMTAAQMQQQMQQPMQQASPPPPPPSAQVAPPPARVYYLLLAGKQAGPFSSDEVYQAVANQTANMSTLIWRRGMPDWIALAESAEFNWQR